MRLLARFIDYSLLYFAGVAVIAFLPFYIGDEVFLYYGLATPFLWMGIDALLLATWGRSPGRAVFGIHGKQDLPLLYRPSRLQKSFGVIGAGMCALAILCVVPWSPISVSVPRSNTTDGWVNYTAQDNRFTVAFPNDPELEIQEVEVPGRRPLNYSEFKSSERKKVTYAVGYIDLPRKWKLLGSKNLLKGAAKLVLENNPDIEILSQQFVRHQNHHALDFRYREEGEEVQGRLVLIGRTLYKLTVSYPPALVDQLHFDEFLLSFQEQTS